MRLPALVLVALLLANMQSAAAISQRPIMVGYSNRYLLPFLNGGILDFEEGENLWAMSPNGSAVMTLVSPTGESSNFRLGGAPILLRQFGPSDREGVWLLEAPDGNRLGIKLAGANKETLEVRYRLVAGLLAEINGSKSAVFLDAEPGMILLPAGTEQTLRLEKPIPFRPGDVQLDLIYPDALGYGGAVGGASYDMLVEPVAARTSVRLASDGDGLRLSLKPPKLHEVGSGGTVPAREGEAILRFSSREGDVSERKAYFLKDGFAEYAGRNVAPSIRPDLKDALNSTYKIVASQEGAAKILQVRPPIAAIRFRESRLGIPVNNITIMAGELETDYEGDRTYVLLSGVSHLTSSLPQPISLDLPLEVYVNGFHSKSLSLRLKEGEVTEAELELYKLTVKTVTAEGSPIVDVAVVIGGRALSVGSGIASYLFPRGVYEISAYASDLEGSTKVDLSSDTEITLILRPLVGLEYWLKVAAAIEVLAIATVGSLQALMKWWSRRLGTFIKKIGNAIPFIRKRVSLNKRFG